MLKKIFKFSNFIILLSILHLDIFAIVILYCNFNGMTVNDTIITCFFTFWGVEILSLAGIKIHKVKYGETYEENLNNDEEEE